MKKETLPQKYFDDVYAASDDPWDFETSAYEAAKYQATIEALPSPMYETALEIGCSIGVLTELLATRCRQLTAIDVSVKALEKARKRCRQLKQVHFQQASFPDELPQGTFDLIVISEVGYYLAPQDWQRAIFIIKKKLKPGGDIILVHWLPEVHDYPQTGDQVHESFKQILGSEMQHINGQRTDRYRLDVWQNEAHD